MSNTGNFYEPEVYDARAQGVPGDIEFFLGLAKDADAAGHPVLELTTGTGRVATPIARAGIRVVGLGTTASGARLGPEMVFVARKGA